MSQARRIPDAAGLQLEAVLLAGGLRALLLQLAHPGIGHGVAAHSGFAADPLARLCGTLTYVYAVAAGDPATARSVIARVDRIHARVVSAPGDAVTYDASDPSLQFWVAATIADTALRIADTVWGRLPDLLGDELLARLGRIGTELGLPPEHWPTSRSAFDTAFAEAATELRLDPVTRHVIAELFAARGAPPWVRAVLPLLIAATLPTVPAVRAELEPLRRIAAPDVTRLVRPLVPVYRVLPVRLRRLPATRLLARARRRATGPRGPGPVVAET